MSHVFFHHSESDFLLVLMSLQGYFYQFLLFSTREHTTRSELTWNQVQKCPLVSSCKKTEHNIANHFSCELLVYSSGVKVTKRQSFLSWKPFNIQSKSDNESFQTILRFPWNFNKEKLTRMFVFKLLFIFCYVITEYCHFLENITFVAFC